MNIIIINEYIDKRDCIEKLLNILFHPIQHKYASDALIQCISHWINDIYRISNYNGIERYFDNTLPLAFYYNLSIPLCSIIKSTRKNINTELSDLLEYLFNKDSQKCLNRIFANKVTDIHASIQRS